MNKCTRPGPAWRLSEKGDRHLEDSEPVPFSDKGDRCLEDSEPVPFSGEAL